MSSGFRLAVMFVIYLFCACTLGHTKSEPGPAIELLEPVQRISVKQGDDIETLAKYWQTPIARIRQLNQISSDSELGKRSSLKVFAKEINGIKKQEFMKVVKRNRKQVKKCYEEFVKRVPGKEGQLFVALEIDRTGVVNSVTYSDSTLNDASVESCIAKEVSGWTFSGVDAFDSVEVEYPFVFKIVQLEN